MPGRVPTLIQWPVGACNLNRIAVPRFTSSGHGLSYSQCAIGNVAVRLPGNQSKICGHDERFTLEVSVSCRGPAVQQVLQVYTYPTFQLTQSQPTNRLLCWSKLPVPADGEGMASISCAASDLGMWDLKHGEYLVAGGVYTITVAQFSGDPDAVDASIEVEATPIPRPGESMRDRAEAYAAAH